MPLHHQHDGQSVIDATSTMIVMRLLSDCGTTTSMMIACTSFILPSGVTYADDSFPKHYA
jgi:hypothetical protein